MSSLARAPHVGSALSCVEILTALYFHSARASPLLVDSPERDRILLSKGHASAALYACLAEAGYLDPARLPTYAADGSVLAEHPSRGTVPGVEVTSGSLGHGLGLGIGLALSAKLRGQSWRVFVVLSDGECNEGSVWEAALWAPRQLLDNLTAIVDFNKFQATGPSTRITALEPLAEKWRSFGWDVVEVNGHDFNQLLPALEWPTGARPRAIIAHTVKGKGVSFMEGDLEWHYRPPSAEDLRRALEEVAAGP
jgi:transketolase